jgi:hypothetical protein
LRSAILRLLFVWVSVAFPLVTGYHVEPVKAAWSGWSPSEFPNNFVSQGVTCNFDEPIYAEYFTGTATNGQYQVQLKFPGLNGLVVHGEAAAAAGESLDSGAGRPRMA